AGKSRTLEHLGAQLARDARARGGSRSAIPVLLPAFLLAGAQSVGEIVRQLLRSTDPQEVEAAMGNGRYVLAVDALDEVSHQDYAHVVHLLKSFMVKHPRCGLIMATRPDSYHNELLLPVYELQALSVDEVREILLVYAPTPE